MSAAVDALDAVLSVLAADGIRATREPSNFHPDPFGVIVGLPSIESIGLANATVTVPVTIVCADPLTKANVDALYALADDAARSLRVATYSATTWQGGINAEPLPAITLTPTITVETETP